LIAGHTALGLFGMILSFWNKKARSKSIERASSFFLLITVRCAIYTVIKLFVDLGTRISRRLIRVPAFSLGESSGTSCDHGFRSHCPRSQAHHRAPTCLRIFSSFCNGLSATGFVAFYVLRAHDSDQSERWQTSQCHYDVSFLLLRARWPLTILATDFNHEIRRVEYSFFKERNVSFYGVKVTGIWF
jgi:hypothetical protein